MKYLIGDTVINAAQIVQVQYFEPGKADTDGKSRCGIELVGASDDWSIWLIDEEADKFWDVYSKDAYPVS